MLYETYVQQSGGGGSYQKHPYKIRIKLNKLTISILTIALVFLSVGVTLTFFNSDLFGTRINTLEAGNIVFNYKEGTDTISINNKALTDEEGKTQNTYFDFEVSLESELPETINYNIYLEKDSTSTIEDKAIKVYLTNQENEEIESVKRVGTLMPVKKTDRKLIYKTSINSQGPKTIQKYRLRVWLDKDYDLTNVENIENGQHITVREKTYKFKVGVNNEKISNLSESWKSKIENEDNFLALYTIDTVELPETYTFEEEEYTLDTTADVSEQKNNGVILGEYKNGENVIALMGQDGGVIASTNGRYLFSMRNLTRLNLNNFNTSNITGMYGMFYNCRNLTDLDLSSFDTSKVTTMQDMFRGCTSLTSLDLSLLDTSNVTNMSYMFYDCSSLTSLDVSRFDTSNVTSMYAMFSGCRNLTSLDLSSFDTSNVTNMQELLYNCSGLTSVDVSSFNTSNVINMLFIFYGCSSLTSLDLSSFDTGKLTGMYKMFRDCSSLTSLDLSNFNTSNVTDMSGMFSGCSSLTSLDLSMLDLSELTTIASSSSSTGSYYDSYGMFYGCSNLETLDISSMNTTNITSMRALFMNCPKLILIKVGCNWDMTNVTNTSNMFSNCGVSSVTKVCPEA